MFWEVHLKKVIWLFFILFICMRPMTSESAQVYLSCRPSLFVEGTIQPAMNADILSSSYDDATGLMEITLNNWGTSATGVPGYKYSDARQFIPGTRITLQIDCGANHSKLGEGRIMAVSPKYLKSGPSTITISALVAVTSLMKPSQISLAYGSNLIEFYPVLKPGVIEASGLISDAPELRKGMSVKVTGVGQRFEGSYSISGTLHTWDLSRGYQIQFKGKKDTQVPTLRK
jgi:hypothetical protein